jgi:hypothetical protein
MNSKYLKSTIAAALCTAAVLAVAGPGGGSGGGGSGGGGGGGSQPSTDLYAEMVLIDRDVNGVPITTLGLGPRDKWVQVPQPIMFGPKTDCPLDFYALVPVGTDSVYNSFPEGEKVDARYIPFVDGEIPEEYKLCMTEADLGRLSVVRSPDDVLDRALIEMVTALRDATAVGLDEAGRLMVTYTEDGELLKRTIDAPAENAAAFQRILEQAKLNHADVGDVTARLPVWPEGETGARHLLNRAAPMLAAASDKFGHVGLDEMIYVTQILDLAGDMTADAKRTFGDPWAGGIFNFDGYVYDRATTYSGNVCYLKVLEATPNSSSDDGLPVDVTAQVVKEPILARIFPPLASELDYVGGLTAGTDYTGFTGENAWGFKQAVDDARAVIFWVHEHPVPVELIEYCELEPGDAVAIAR